LRSAGECYINGNIPDGAIGNKACVLPSFGVVRDTSTFDSFDLVEQIDINALFIDHGAGRVRGGHAGAARLLCVVDRVDSTIARAGERHGGAAEGGAFALQHSLGKHDSPVAGSVGTHQGTARGAPFAGKRAGLKTV